MNSIEQHIKPYIKKLVSSPRNGFEQAYNLIKNEVTEEIKKLLIYFDSIVSDLINQGEGLQYVHIHIEGINKEYSNVLVKFLLVRFYIKALMNDQCQSKNIVFDNEISEIKKILSQNSLPEGVKSSSREFKAWLKNRKDKNERIKFLNFLKDTNPFATLFPNSIINLLISTKNELSNEFVLNEIGLPIELLPNKSSYVILNEKSFSQLKDVFVEDKRLLTIIENVIVFNSQRRSEFKEFNFFQLKKYNQQFGTKFKNLIIVSTDYEKQPFSSLKNKLETIESRFIKLPKYPNYNTYIISTIELGHILDKPVAEDSSIGFFDERENILWEEFKHMLSFYVGLEELTSIKLMNIYSFAFNSKLKSIILSKIFCNDKSSILKKETREILHNDLSENAIGELKKSLSNILDYIITSQWLEQVKQYISSNSIILIPEYFFADIHLRSEIASTLGSRPNHLKSWFVKFDSDEKEILILDYRDRGRFPFNIKPNIQVNSFEYYKSIHGIFISYFFQNKYDWNEYQFRSNRIKLLKHPLKEKLFSWQEIEETNLKTKPTHKELIYNWDEENTYSSNSENSIYKVYLKNQRRPLSCYGADLFIYSSEFNNSIFRVLRIDELIKVNEEKLSIQKLEDFYDTLNLADSLSPPKTHNKEVEFLLKQYGLNSNYPPEKLWKKLLSDKSQKNSDIYNEIQKFFEANNIKLVSFQRFQYSWIDVESDILIPRGKKIFSLLCDYLNLPKSYYLIMRRIRNSGRSNERLRTSINNKMFKYLFNDGCFDPESDLKEIITTNLKLYKKEIDFEELGIEEDVVIINELVSLVELLSKTLHLKELEKIKTSSDD